MNTAALDESRVNTIRVVSIDYHYALLQAIESTVRNPHVTYYFKLP